jgi:hypothetical protein
MKADEILRQHRIELRQMASDVMPDHWTGHGEIIIYESNEIPTEIEQLTINKMNELVEMKDVNPETAAELIIKKYTEK